MIRYEDLIQYTKENHVNLDTDLFDVLRGFFEQYSTTPTPPSPVQQEIIFPTEEFKEPEDGEYTIQDLMRLFST